MRRRNPGMSKLIVSLPLGRIRQHLIRFGAFLELDLGFLFSVAVIAIWMILHRQSAIRPLDLVTGGGARDAQNLVIVTFSYSHCPIKFQNPFSRPACGARLPVQYKK